jgi:hypothetical protein
MHLPQVHYLAVLVAGVVIFVLGGLWYSALFAKTWMALQGKTEEEMKAAAAGSPVAFNFIQVFICGLISAWTLAVILNHFDDLTAARGAMVGALCWLGFAGVTSYGTAIFSMKPIKLWLIDSGFNLVSFVIAGIILACWR